jgi:two-component system NtrC family sensor kinase
MNDKSELLELKDLLDHLRIITAAKEKILLSYIQEEDELYNELSKKVLEIKEKNKAIEETRAIMSKNERLFTLGVMAASLAHEIKNPLIVIMGMLNRLEKMLSEKEQKEHLEIIKKETERIHGIMNGLTEFYKPRETHKELYNINNLIRDTIKLTEHYLSRFKKIDINSNLSDSVPDFYLNKGQIQQVMVNMIINAAQAMPDGGNIIITTSVEKNTKTDSPPMVRIQIEDSGYGISSENVEKIFEPFFTTKAPGEGTGIGLSISKEIINRHKGSISVSSEVSKGTRFDILLPCVETI